MRELKTKIAGYSWLNNNKVYNTYGKYKKLRIVLQEEEFFNY